MQYVWKPLRAAKYYVNRRPSKPAKPKRRRLSMRPEKRPQTIMEAYRRRELMRQTHNKPVWNSLVINHAVAGWALTQEPMYGPTPLTRGL